MSAFNPGSNQLPGGESHGDGLKGVYREHRMMVRCQAMVLDGPSEEGKGEGGWDKDGQT
jgi:hypothetical protein